MSFGNPIFRFRLIHDIAGTYEISEPQGWIEAKLQLSRDENFHSLVEGFTGGFSFYGSNGIDDGGINFIRNIEFVYGFDANLTVDIDVSFDSGNSYEDIFEGLYDFSLTEETNNNKIKAAIIRNDFWSKFINRLDTPVDIMSNTDLDGNAINVPDPMDIYLKSQKLQLTYQADSKQGDDSETIGIVSAVTTIPNGSYLQIDWGQENLDEIEEKYNIPVEVNPALPAFILFPEYGGLYHIQQTIYAYIVRFSGGLPVEYFSVKSQSSPNYPGSTNYVDFYIRINDIEYPLQWTELNPHSLIPDDQITRFTYNDFHDLQPSDKVYIYGRMNATFNPSPDPGESFFFVWNINEIFDFTQYVSTVNIVAETIFPDSTADGFFLHDVGAAIADRITGVNSSFYSALLGSDATTRIYPSNGCHWKYALTKGLQLRQYTLQQKPFFLSFKQWWEGANPILNLGLGYNVVNGAEVVEVKRKEDFYDESISVNFDYVFDIIRRYDNEVIFKKINIGYKKWESENLSGIDDPQTKHTYATRLQKVGQDINIESEFMAASLAIEQTRRQTIVKSKDYKLDNDTFIIALGEPTGSPDTYNPELDENFSSITNLLNADTRYNSRITPARNLQRWLNYLNGCLQNYLTSVYKFVSGQGNFDMTSNLNVSCDVDGEADEKGNINVTDDYLHRPELFEITLSMSWDEYVVIRNNRNKAIGISQTNTGHVPFLIKDLQYELCKSKAVIQAWPKLYFNVVNTDFVQPELQCAQSGPVVTSCDDAYLTEDLFELITEDGDCLIIE